MARLLFIENSLTDQELIRQAALQAKQSIDVEFVDDVPEALSWLRTQPDSDLPVVLTEVSRPSSDDGLDLLRAVRKDQKLANLHVVVLAETTDTQERKVAKSAGCNNYLTRPKSVGDMADFLDTLAGQMVLLPPATMKNGRYALGSLLGRGGSAVVYRCHDTWMQVDRAIKLIGRTGPAGEPQRRLQVEAEAMAAVRHTNVLKVFDVGHWEGFDFLVVELADGGTLQDFIDTNGPLSFKQLEQLFIPVVEALAVAHSLNIVHRDLKPNNILLSDEQKPLLSDFGVAKHNSKGSTDQGAVLGSLAFMPPEQRLDSASVTPRADVYAAGCTLFALLTAHNPTDLFTEAKGSPRFSGIPASILEVIIQAVKRRPQDRYPDAKAFGRALKSAIVEVQFPAKLDELTRIPTREFIAPSSEELSDALPAQPATTFPEPAVVIPLRYLTIASALVATVIVLLLVYAIVM